MPRSQGTSRKGKPKKNERAAGMGRALQKSKGKKHTPSASTGGMAMRQGVDSLNIVKEDNRASVLDMNNLDDFLVQAEMANREFASEKEQVVMLDSYAQAAEEDNYQKSIQWIDQPVKAGFAFHELSVPRRPTWDETTTAEELDKREKESFLDWRRSIAQKEEEIVLAADSSMGVTPFEKNLEIWRQLWRVMERCSIVVQVVDARNPLFYLSKDLKEYATKELGKPMLLLVNKSDYLTPLQRQAWHQFLSDPENPWEHVFFSAHEQQQIIDEESHRQAGLEDEAMAPALLPEDGDEDEAEGDKDEEKKQLAAASTKSPTIPSQDNIGIETPLSRTELLSWLRNFSKENDCEVDSKHDRLSFGMVGFPNVGKSSVINVLMNNAKHAHGVVRVGVAAQPGKTKHFQTLLLPDQEDLMLCDCPGLVFPSFVSNTADLIAAGVYPIAQMRDPGPVVSLLCRRIPRLVLNAHYGIQIPMPSADKMLGVKNGKIPSPTAEEFLNSYCLARSMLAAGSGVPDFQRAARFVVSDYAVGKLLYCHAPPSSDDGLFQKETLTTAMRNTKKLRNTLEETASTDKAEEDAEYPESEGDEDDDDDEAEEGLGIEEDDMLLELMGQESSSSQPEKNTRTHQRKKRWGKKGRKLRNSDPYGCHSSPDDMLTGDKGPLGVTLKGGKYSKKGKKGYVRPAAYGDNIVADIQGD
jgi:large subunit GTPase 1